MCATLRVLLMAAVVMAASGVALADSFTFDMGDSSWIDTSGTISVLEMWATVYGSVGGEVFTLDEGDSYSFLFARMGTDETAVNPSDDLTPGSVTAYVEFDIPSLTPDVDGVTVGFRGGWLGFTQGWDLVWDDPVIVDFAGGGQFSLELSDASLRNGWWMGPDGPPNCYADISATVTLIDAPAIPEPATISLLGLALAGWAVRRKIMA